MDGIQFESGAVMQRLFALILAGGALAAQAQSFVCGQPEAAQAGAVQLTASSVYSPATPGFDLNTVPEVKAGFCSSDKPFFFSAALPEGSYRVTVLFGSIQPSSTTVRAEARRLMIEQVAVTPGAPMTRSFDVNLRVPQIAGDPNHLVKLKPREIGNLDWDDKLTLEFNGGHPSIHSITIEPLHETTIYLAGDSTVVDQDVEPWAAWGQMLPRFFRPGVVIANHAESGETIHSFVEEQRLAKILSLMRPGDYLFIQFGHNDQKPNAVSLADYKTLLVDYIGKARSKGATPVLVTSMNRRTFDGAGKITNSLSPYTEAVREIAAAQHVALIDLNAMSKTLFEAMGPEASLKAFMHYPANAFPNQPNAISDDTHFNSYGAYELARCVLHGIRAAKLPLVEFLNEDVADFDPSHPDSLDAFHLPPTPIPPETIAALYRQFQAPPDDARPMMRWWWFGPAVTKPELQKELETMRAAGIGGVEIQPVYPLMLDDESKGIKNLAYLSPEFLDDVRFTNLTAHSLGLRVDLTLGSGWPYGGPKTTLADAAGRLRVVAIPLNGITLAAPTLAEGDKLVAAFVVTGTEKSFNPATAQRIDMNTWAIPDVTGTRTALIFVASHTRQMVKRAAFGAEGYVLDHFSRAAIDAHLAGVATPLLEAFGEQPPYAVFSDSLEVYASDWTANLPAEFLARRGYDLIPHLPELLAGGSPQAEAVRHDWGRTLSDLIRENYLAPVTRFAAAHHTRFRSQTYGEPAVTLADEAVPNLPEGEGPQWRSFSFTRWASSANHLYGNNVTSAETWTWLHSPAFRATPLDMKAEADRMFLLGVNQFVGHGYPYSPAAAGEPGWCFYAAAALNAHNPWFPVMPDVTRYLQRMSWLLRQGKPANDIAILLPEDDAQAAFTPGHVSVTDEMRKRITPELMTAILDAGYNIDYIDAATIDKLGVIPYPVLILPPTGRIPLTTYKKIESYAANSNVIALEKLPSLAPGLMEQSSSAEIAAISGMIFQNSNHKGIQIASISDLAEALHKALPPDIDATGQISNLGFIHRKLDGMDLYVVVNSSNQPVNGSIKFRAAHAFIESWNPDGGAVLESAAYAKSAGIPLRLAPYESRVFVLAEAALAQKSVSARPAQNQTEHLLQDLSSGWQIRFGEDTSTQSVDQLASWTELPGKQFYSGKAVYTRTFTLTDLPEAHARVLLDFGEGVPTIDNRPPHASGMRALFDPPIREAAIVSINGQRAGALWHPPYRIDITSLLHRGENLIEVTVYNTAINEMAGQPPRDYTALNARYGKRFDPQDMDHLQPVPSGMMGPIRLLEMRPQ
jgi:lysophospholipase L1-like esterase